MCTVTDSHQPSLLDVRSAPRPQSDVAGVAQVLVDVALPHLDHTFDYAIPTKFAEQVTPGVRVKVRFAGVERDGFVLGRTRNSDHEGSLAPLRRVVSEVPVLTGAVLDLARQVAARYAGTTMDVLRMAVPPRHAQTEKSVFDKPAVTPPQWREEPDALPDPSATAGTALESSTIDSQPWAPYPGGAAFLRRIRAGESPRAVWAALPTVSPPTHPDAIDTETPATPTGPHWAEAITAAAGATRLSGRSTIVCLPDQQDVDLLSAVMTTAGLDHAVLTADQGRAARYRRFLLALAGQAHVVIGTRSAAFAPVAQLGLVVCWDDGDDLHIEPRAPYPHIRTVLALRADAAGAAALVGGFIRTPEAQLLVRDGWARSLHAPRAAVREHTPRVQAPSDVDLDREGAAGRARVPGSAIRLLRSGLSEGPVLVQVPRSGYLPVVACADCRTPARCGHCHGPLALDRQGGNARCTWCGRSQLDWRCAECGHQGVRAVRVGSRRTAEELGRAFPGVLVRTSGADGGVLPLVENSPQLVVATPGAEPRTEEGYAAGLLLDAAVFTARPELGAGIEALRRWMRAAALVRPSARVMLLGHGAPVPVQALVRWDPVGYAERELDERSELEFPPLVRMASVTGDASAVRGLTRRLELPPSGVLLGPVQTAEPEPGGEPQLQVLARVAREDGAALARTLAQAQAIRSARKESGLLRVRLDPDRLV
ncbi:MAG TPA: primosomal protein N' [Candidatus Ruania gallistercoris]|uniref:Probable replication restart protein PriA n=1 Tax=Candidatus Ruania gallistercoris TaxID=2838746 RepID=A0A9D2J4U3_9MICO|nr:primosomal protein N' [Candidatus Ruania gallistercoris]